MAYRTADHERWKKMDFVVGVEVHLSGNHTCKGRDGKPHKFEDICDQLAGKYPKDFKFTGWHPHCRCFATSILKTDKEIAEDTRRILRGERPTGESENTVEDVPEGFNDWLEKNEERIERANTLPYFLRDNRHLLSSAKHGYTGDRFGHSMTRKEKAAIEGHQELHDYSPEQERNFRDITEATGYQRGEPMTFDDADNGRANTVGDKDNCAVCVLVHELRLRGYDITALLYNRKENAFTSLSGDTRSIWLTKKGKIPEFTSKIGGSEREIALKIERATQGIGSRYHLGWDNKMGRGHIITAVRTKEGLILYDPQKNEYFSLSEIVQEMHPESKLELLRVDRLLVNPNSLNKLTQSVV